MLLIAVLALVLPLSICFWIATLVYSGYPATDFPSPLRWLLCFLIPLAFAAWGLKRKSLDWSGALAGLIVGFILTLSNYCFLATLIAFFLSSSKATRYQSKKKEKIEVNFKEGGQRNWIQVICNGGVATEMALLYMIESGIGEKFVDFYGNYNGSWFAMAVLAALASANGDTWASELGTVLSDGDPVLITSLRKVPKGTNGAVSLQGLVLSAIGGAVVGLAYYFALLLCLTQESLALSPCQWPVVPYAAFAGFFGSLVDSILGATLQYSGFDTRTRKVVEQPDSNVKYISGVRVLDNHSVNLITSAISALLLPRVAVALWSVLR